MRISDWSSDVCSSDLRTAGVRTSAAAPQDRASGCGSARAGASAGPPAGRAIHRAARSEEHTSELLSLMRISYAVFCLKKNRITHQFLPNITKHATDIVHKHIVPIKSIT